MALLPGDLNSRESQKFSAHNAVQIGGAEMTVRCDYDGSNNLIYVGVAEIGSAQTANVWQIRKLTYTGTNLTSVLWANGNPKLINIWNNRASLSYS